MFDELRGPTSFRLSIVLALVVALVGAIVRPARAAPPDEIAGPVDPEAHRLYEEGLTYYQRGDFTAAISSLQRAYARAPAPTLLYNLAQAHRMNHDCRRARDLYRSFLDKQSSGVLHDRAESLLREMEVCLATTGPRGHAAPVLAASSAGSPSLIPTVAASPPPTSLLQPVAGRSRPFRGAAYTLAATTAVLASLSIYFAWRTVDASRDVSEAFRPGDSWDEADREAEQRGPLSYKLELASAGGALITGGIAAWLYYRDR